MIGGLIAGVLGWESAFIGWRISSYSRWRRALAALSAGMTTPEKSHGVGAALSANVNLIRLFLG